jgi:micrococcal nuclease
MPSGQGLFSHERQCTVKSIHDGDTIRVTCDGRHAKVRFYCIDAPELAQRPWGIESRDRLRAIAPRTVRVVEHDRDRYGRIVGEVFAGERSLNLELVSDGYAAVYAHYCREGRYYAAERHAKAAELGIWAKPGEQQRPWEWRHRH